MRRTTLTRPLRGGLSQGRGAQVGTTGGGEQILDPFGLVGLIYSWLSTGNEAGVASFATPILAQ